MNVDEVIPRLVEQSAINTIVSILCRKESYPTSLNVNKTDGPHQRRIVLLTLGSGYLKLTNAMIDPSNTFGYLTVVPSLSGLWLLTAYPTTFPGQIKKRILSFRNKGIKDEKLGFKYPR